MIPVDLITKGFDLISGAGLDLFKTIVGEVDKHRLIDYGELRVKDANREKLDKLMDGGLNVKRQAKHKGAYDDGYRTS